MRRHAWSLRVAVATVGMLSAAGAAAMESSTTVESSAAHADPALDRGRCEFGRVRAAESFGQIGLFIGLLGGGFVGAELSRNEDGGYEASGPLMGMAVGGVGGWLLGRGFGRITHPCHALEWSERSRAEWTRYEAERKAFDLCIKRKGRAVLLGLLVGSAAGAAAGYAIYRDDAGGLILGAALGEVIGMFLGDYWSADCRTPMAMRYSGMPLELPPEVRP